MQIKQSPFYDYIQDSSFLSEKLANEFVLVCFIGFLVAYGWNVFDANGFSTALLFAFGAFGYATYAYKSYVRFVRTTAEKTVEQNIGQNVAPEQLLSLKATKLILGLEQKTGNDLLTSFFNYPQVKKYLSLLEINPEDIISELSGKLDWSVESFLGSSKLIAISEATHQPISVESMVYAFLKDLPNFETMLQKFRIKEEDFALAGQLLYNQENVENDFLKKDIQGIGKLWGGGYTINLDKSAREILGEVAKHTLPHELRAIKKPFVDLVNGLLNPPGNILLVGEVGSGKETLLHLLAEKSWAGVLPDPLNYQRFFLLNAAEFTTRPEEKQRLEGLLYEAAAAQDIVIAIDHIEKLYDPTAGVYGGDVLDQFLNSRLMIIGITTPFAKTHFLQKQEILKNKMTEVNLASANKQDTLFIAYDYASKLSKASGIPFSLAALSLCIDLTEEYITNKANPEKTLLILEKAFTSGRPVTRSVIEEIMSDVVKAPISKANEKTADKLLSLESILKKEIAGQDEAITQLVSALKRSSAGLRTGHRPIGSFLFCGPTGVGKTEVCKALSRNYFEGKMLRFDMSEYQNPDAVERLIGTETSPGTLTEAIYETPYCLILLDEIEKAYKGVLDLFLQVLDDARLTSGDGKTVNFKNTIIVGTSNIGSSQIQELTQQQNANFNEEVKKIIQTAGAFRPEFLNRFDDVIVFKPLTQDELSEVARLSLDELNKNLKAKNGITVKGTPELLTFLTEKGYDPEFGARPLRRLLQDTIENYIADLVLKEQVKPGDTVTIPSEILTK